MAKTKIAYKGAHVDEHIFEKSPTLKQGISLEAQKSRTEKFFPSMHNKAIGIDKIKPAPDEWNIFPAPPEGVYNLIKESIRNQGQLDPIRVWEQKDGSYMCLGGHTRLRIFKELLMETGDEYYQKIKCHIYEENQIDEVDAQQIIIIDNASQRAQESIEVRRNMVKAYHKLLQKDTAKKRGIQRKSIIEDIAEHLDLSESAVKRLWAQRKVLPQLLELGDKKEISQVLVDIFARIPGPLQEYIYQNELWKKSLDKYQLKELPGALSVEDVDTIYNKARRYDFSGDRVILSHAIPRSFTKFSLAADKEDMKKLIPKLSKTISDMNDIKDETKATLIEILDTYK